jgi:flagellin
MSQFSVINNLSSMEGQQALQGTQKSLSKVFQRLSTGLRINSASDDAAGLVISSSLRSDVRSLNQAMRNGNDGITLTQLAEDSLKEVTELLTRGRELAEQAASDTSGADSSGAKQAIDAEYSAIKDEVTRIAATIDFNGTKLFAADTTFDIQIGLASGSDYKLTLSTKAFSAGDFGSTTTSIDGHLSTSGSATALMSKIDAAIDFISAQRSKYGAFQNRLTSVVNSLQNQTNSITAIESQIRDANMAEEVVNLSKYQVLQQTGAAGLAQANQASSVVLSLLRG